MPAYPHRVALGMAVAFVLYGCAAPSDSSVSTASPAAGGLPPPVESVPTVSDGRPAALIDGRAVRWGDLRPTLTEVAGADALREIALDHGLERAVADAGLRITDDDVEVERRRLLDTLGDDPNEAVRLLDELRNRQRLSRERFLELLRRNAALRALVRDRVEITEGAVRQAYDVRYGPKRQVRLLTTNDLSVVQAAIGRAEAGVFFGDLAVEISSDASAARGGLLEPVARQDPSYPSSLRQAIWSVAGVGDVSGATLMGGGYAVVQLVREIPADGTAFDDVRTALEREVRLGRERLLMEQLARSLVADAKIVIFDDALNESWNRGRQE